MAFLLPRIAFLSVLTQYAENVALVSMRWDRLYKWTLTYAIGMYAENESLFAVVNREGVVVSEQA
jgi:hypothetical protein